MFANPEPLDSIKHRALRLTSSADMSFARELTTVPLSVMEVIEAAKHYVVVLPMEGEPIFQALLALGRPHNVYVGADGRWAADYIPAHVRRYPFILGATNAAEQFTVMIDPDAPHLSTERGEPLFSDTGEQSPLLGGAIQFLELFQRELLMSKSVLQPLLDYDLLQPRQFEIERQGQPKQIIAGFRVIDTDKLAALPDAAFLALRDSGILPIIYAHVASLTNLRRLIDLDNATS